MEFSRKKNFFVMFILSLPFLLYLCFVPVLSPLLDFTSVVGDKFQYIIGKAYTKNFVYKTASLTNSIETVNPRDFPKPLANPPAVLKVAYATGWSAGSKNYLTYLDNLFTTTQINALVIDVKDYSGIVSYKTNAKSAKEYHAYRAEIPDIDALIKRLHDRGIYVIGRVVVFEDPVLAKHRPDLALYDVSKTKDAASRVTWQNGDGLAWMDPAAPAVWDYNIEIAKDALAHGFDEINFDYIRFPTDGDTNNIGFPVWNQKTPKNFVIKSFFKKLRDSFPDTKISADIFGQTTSNTDDMGIGQIFEDSLSYFDYVCPMVYPSHYAHGFLGYQNPAEYPYQVIKYAISRAQDRKRVYEAILDKSNTDLPNGSTVPTVAKIRPWLQDFSLGGTAYDVGMVRQEIKAVVDATGKDFSGYMLWNPSNIYTKGAIAKEPAAPQ